MGRDILRLHSNRFVLTPLDTKAFALYPKSYSGKIWISTWAGGTNDVSSNMQILAASGAFGS